MAEIQEYNPLVLQENYVKHLPRNVISLLHKHIDRIDLEEKEQETLDLVFKQAPPLTANLVVYRGLVLYHEDLNLCFTHILSTSLSKEMAVDFSNNDENTSVVMRITLVKGTHVLPLYNISNENENEVILNRNTQLDITKVQTIDGVKYIDVTNQTFK